MKAIGEPLTCNLGPIDAASDRQLDGLLVRARAEAAERPGATGDVGVLQAAVRDVAEVLAGELSDPPLGEAMPRP